MGESLIIRSGGGTDTSEATATNDVVVTGYTCYVKDELVIGNIPIPTVDKKSLVPSEQIDLSHGYYKGTDQISASTLSDETVATAVSSDLLSTYKGWAGGNLIDGTMVNRGAISQSFGVNASYIIPQGWHNGSGKVTQALAVQGYVGITASTGNQTVCDAGRWTTGEQWVWGDGNLVPWNIKNGVEIFGVWGNFTGWVDGNSGNYNLCQECHTYTSGESYHRRFFTRNVYWRGWNYFNVYLVHNTTVYNQRIDTKYLPRIWTNTVEPGYYTDIQGDSSVKFVLPTSYPSGYLWQSTSPMLSKQAMSETLKNNLAQKYGSGVIPVVWWVDLGTAYSRGYYMACSTHVFYFSLS